MVNIESLLIEVLPKGDSVDGHDAGSGEVNIFVETDDPQRTYQRIRSVLGVHDAWSGIRIAYRNMEGGPYTVLWPSNLRQFSVA